MIQVRRRQPDGELGPYEPLFPAEVEVDPNIMLLLEAIAGQQEQIMLLQAEVEALKGGAE